MNLTIVVTTIPERAQLLSRCLWYLSHQSVQDFEVVVAHGQQGKGDKVTRALSVVDTSHVLFVDDDDWVSPRLVESVRPELGGFYDFDFVGYDLVQMVDGMFSQIVPQVVGSHICPIRTDLARAVPFGNDYPAAIEWTNEVARSIGTSTYLSGEPLYFYDKWNQADGRWSPPRRVGYWPVDKAKFRWV